MDDSLLDGSKFKSEVLNELLKYTEYDPRDTSPLNADSVVIDAMRVLNEKAANVSKKAKTWSMSFDVELE